jgi:hypothetical protein
MPTSSHVLIKNRAPLEADWTAFEQNDPSSLNMSATNSDNKNNNNIQARPRTLAPDLSSVESTSATTRSSTSPSTSVGNNSGYAAAVKKSVAWPSLPASGKSKLKPVAARPQPKNIRKSLGTEPTARGDLSDYPPLGNIVRLKKEPNNSKKRIKDKHIASTNISRDICEQENATDATVVTPSAVSNTHSQGQPNTNHPAKHLLDDDDDDDNELPELNFAPMEFTTSPYTEKLQSSSEVETRNFHNTMNQGMARPKATKKSLSVAGRLEIPDPPGLGRGAKPLLAEKIPADPLPAFIKELEINFKKLLEGVRAFRGDVKLEARFGRILLRGIKLSHIVDKDDKDRSLSESALQSNLHPPRDFKGARRPTTSFTNKLTTVPAEITSLTEMSAPEEEVIKLWSAHSTWTVFYSFTFREKVTDVPFVIEIDAETFATRIKLRRSFGQLNIHGTKRVWDFQIQCTGVTSDEEDVEPYTELATKLKETLFIP